MKVSGSYESVVRGVSEQVPQDRLSGQCEDQVNMVPDPVRGLARRQGSVTVAEVTQPHTWSSLLANTASHRAFTFSINGNGFDLLYRTGARVAGGSNQDGLFCFDRVAEEFIPVSIHSTTATAALAAGGVSAITQVGRFVLMAGNTYATTWSTVEKYAVTSNKAKLAVWVKGGGYSRTYSVTFTAASGGAKTTISYKTKSSSYPTLLDTTDLLTSDAQYQKKVNDRVYAYNSQVTAWIGTAAADIAAENIAQKLAEAYIAAALPGTAVASGTSTVVFDTSHWSEITVGDGGDGSLITCVGNVIEAAEDVTPRHYAGKVVKVLPSKESPDSAYYLQAYPKDEVSTGWCDVVWKEGASAVSTPVRLFILATVQDGTLYVSDDLAWMDTALGSTLNEVPLYKGSTVGDAITNPLPNFMGKRIDYLGMFQDRLIVGSGAVISASRRGDYFNFFRRTSLSILQDDPVEEFSLGSEEDVIKHGTLFNRDLILYGRKGQYSITGRVPLTPQTAGIVSTVSKYESSIDAVPQVSGNLAFYAAKRGPDTRRTTSLQQIQPAALSENPVSQDVSQQLDTYLKGTAIELLTLTKPNTVLLRTDDNRNSLYLYNYLDRTNGERLLDAWHRWQWDGSVGHILGMSATERGEIYIYVVRQAADGQSWLACEKFSLASAMSPNPHLDAQRPSASPGSLTGGDTLKLAKAYGSGDNAFMGSTLAELAVLANPPALLGSKLGVIFPSYVTPTNPFPRDNQNRAITFGRLTLGMVRPTVADTGGFVISATQWGTTADLLDFNGFLLGQETALIGTQPIVSQSFATYVGGEVRECSYTVHSKRWLPLTITSIEWSGQLFNHQRRP